MLLKITSSCIRDASDEELLKGELLGISRRVSILVPRRSRRSLTRLLEGLLQLSNLHYALELIHEIDDLLKLIQLNLLLLLLLCVLKQCQPGHVPEEARP
jgi:hypothetical protein